MNEVKILGKSGYDDGYYLDYRIDFEYKGDKFKYIDVGSGYFLTYRAIMMLIKEYAEICMANNGEFIFEDEWDELDEEEEDE